MNDLGALAGIIGFWHTHCYVNGDVPLFMATIVHGGRRTICCTMPRIGRILISTERAKDSNTTHFFSFQVLSKYLFSSNVFTSVNFVELRDTGQNCISGHTPILMSRMP